MENSLIENKMNRTLYMMGKVSYDSVEDIIKRINEINLIDEVRNQRLDYIAEPIELYINSYGGCVDACLGLVTTILNSKTQVIGYVNGNAQSAGFYIFLACHKRYMQKYSYLMYHHHTMHTDGAIDSYKKEIINTDYDFVNELLMKYVVDNAPISKDLLENSKRLLIDSSLAEKYKLIDGIY